MKKINWKVRLQNPVFLAQIVMSILLPILTYMGLTMQDLTSWDAVRNVLLQALSNPYILGLVIVSVFNAINDPTTNGLTDSANALKYDHPNADK